MSTAAGRAQRAVEAHEDDETIPCGTGKAQRYGGSMYGVLSEPFASNLDIVQGRLLQLAYHPETDSFILTPVEK